ncbi:MAG: ribbon-helix-helix protein, CopG family [Paracoccaceae bacterium]|nr:ribbon-helix-helix protein, CopG family [Paracoccaceae bacterium]
MARDIFLKVRVTEAERKRFNALAEGRERPLGEIIREVLARLAARDEKKGDGG